MSGGNDGLPVYTNGGLRGTSNAQFFTGYCYGPFNCEGGADCGSSKVRGTLTVTAFTGNVPEPGSLVLLAGALA